MYIGRLTQSQYPVIWLTGQSGSGKSTLSRELFKKLDAIILDGDEMRECISVGLGLDAEGRIENNLRIARLAHILSFQKKVIVAVIAPFAETRKKIDSITQPVWIHLHRDDLISTNEKPYEKPDRPHLMINTGKKTVDESVNMILDFLNTK